MKCIICGKIIMETDFCIIYKEKNIKEFMCSMKCKSKKEFILNKNNFSNKRHKNVVF